MVSAYKTCCITCKCTMPKPLEEYIVGRNGYGLTNICISSLCFHLQLLKLHNPELLSRRIHSIKIILCNICL